MKKYNNLEEYLKEVKATGIINTDIEFIVHIQDLIGHSTYEELHNLSRNYKVTFYRVFDEACGIEETLRFFAEHSNFSERLNQEAADAECERDKNKALLQISEEKNEQLTKDLQNTRKELEDQDIKNGELRKENKALKEETTALKARLYDLITK